MVLQFENVFDDECNYEADFTICFAYKKLFSQLILLNIRLTLIGMQFELNSLRGIPSPFQGDYTFFSHHIELWSNAMK